MGWMPTAVDLSTWNSIWTLERIKQTGYHPELRSTLREFNVGYIASGLLAVISSDWVHWCHTPTERPAGRYGSVCSGHRQPVHRGHRRVEPLVIGAAAFSAMLGACIACLDGYSQALARSAIPCVPRPQTRLAHARTVVTGRGFSRSACAHLGLPQRHPNAGGCFDHLGLHRGTSRPLPTGTLSAECDSPRPHAHRWLHVLAGLGMLFLVGFTLLCFA